MLIGGSLLSAMFLAGCANDQDPPPEDDMIENPADDNGDMNGDNNGNVDDDGMIDDENNDINTDNDGDMMEDDNTPGEDAVEDNLDMNDADDKDK